MAPPGQTLETAHGSVADRVHGDAAGIPLVLCQRFRGTIDDGDREVMADLSRRRRDLHRQPKGDEDA